MKYPYKKDEVLAIKLNGKTFTNRSYPDLFKVDKNIVEIKEGKLFSITQQKYLEEIKEGKSGDKK